MPAVFRTLLSFASPVCVTILRLTLKGSTKRQSGPSFWAKDCPSVCVSGSGGSPQDWWESLPGSAWHLFIFSALEVDRARDEPITARTIKIKSELTHPGPSWHPWETQRWLRSGLETIHLVWTPNLEKNGRAEQFPIHGENEEAGYLFNESAVGKGIYL